MAVSSTFNLDEYLDRIGYARVADDDAAALKPDVATLFALHRAHTSAIPFENLDIQMGRGISLEPEALQAKLVRQRRGGYCFEQNGLLQLVLESIGFEYVTCEARVRLTDHGAMRPRTHMVLTVTCEGRGWLADAGFGADGLIEPAPLDGSPVDQVDATYRVASEGSLRVLQRRVVEQDGWEDIYAIMPEPVYAIDYQMGNWYTSTHPRGGFVQTLTAQRIIGGARHAVRNLTYTISRGTDVQVHELTRDALVPLLRDTFGLDIPPDATFHAVDSKPD